MSPSVRVGGGQPYAIGSAPRHHPPREVNVSSRSCHLREGPRRCGFSTIALAPSQSRVFPRDDLGSGPAEGFRSSEGTTNGYRTGCPRVVVSSAGKASFIKVRRLPPASPLSTSTSPSGSFATRTISPVAGKLRDRRVRRQRSVGGCRNALGETGRQMVPARTPKKFATTCK